MKDLLKKRDVISKALRAAFSLAVLISCTLFLFTPDKVSAQTEVPLVSIKVGKELRKLYSLSVAPESVSIPVYSSSGEMTGVREQQLITVTDKESLYGILIPTEGGFFGTVVDQSSQTPVYYQLSPKVHVSKDLPVKRTAAIVQDVTKLKAEDLLLPSHCGDELEVSHLNHKMAKLVNPTVDTTGWRELELFVVSSSEFSGNRLEESITAQILSTVAAANLFFEPLELKITLSGVQIFRADNDPYLEALKRADADEMLNVARAQWSKNVDVKRDVVAVFGTGNYKRYTSANTISSTDIFGLAYTATACTNKDFSVLFASQGTTDTKGELSLAATLAHELGHTLGMSHDSNLYNQVPSLMYPTFTYNPSGFSDVSTKQYLTYTGPGASGGACLSSIPTPEVVAFEGGSSETISIKEGETFTRTIKIGGAKAAYSAAQLLAGTTFNSASAELVFQPSFDLATKKSLVKVVRQKIVAQLMDGRQFTKELVFKVTDVNRAPVVRAIKVARGNGITVSFSVIDPDGDKLTIANETIRNIRWLAGRKDFRFDGKRVYFTWIPERNRRGVPLIYKIVDVQGLSTTVSIPNL